jgi:hypothetical protein
MKTRHFPYYSEQHDFESFVLEPPDANSSWLMVQRLSVKATQAARELERESRGFTKCERIARNGDEWASKPREKSDHFMSMTLEQFVSERLSCGWDEGAAKLKKYDASLEGITDGLSPTSIDRIREFTFEGDDLHIDRVYGGQVEQAWERRKRKAGKLQPTATILMQNCVWGSTDQEKMFWLGVPACVLTDKLESAGFRVELYVATYGKGCFPNNPTKSVRKKNGSLGKARLKEGYHLSLTQVKAPNDPLRLGMLAATLCDPHYFRGNQFITRTVGVPEGCSFNTSSQGQVAELLTAQGTTHVEQCFDALGIDREEAIILPKTLSEDSATKVLTEKLQEFCNA